MEQFDTEMAEASLDDYDMALEDEYTLLA